MNVTIIHKADVKDEVLDRLAQELPVIISGLLEIPGGKLAILKPDQVSLQFTEASRRDTGADLRILVLAKDVGSRTAAEHKLATAILEKVVALVDAAGQKCSVAIRLYLTEIGAAQHSPA